MVGVVMKVVIVGLGAVTVIVTVAEELPEPLVALRV